MTSQDYAAERRDPRWQKKRLEILNRDGFKCRGCGDGENTLHVHHTYYIKGRKCWDYPNFSLRTVCEACHGSEHEPRVKDPEEVQSDIAEWEHEIDWLLLGDGENAGIFWHLAAELAMAFRDGFSYADLIAHVNALRERK